MTAIVERALLNRVDVQITDTASAFILGSSWLDGGAKLGASGSAPWRSVTAKVTNITSRRGGVREGITIRNKPGMLSITLRDTLPDPRNSPYNLDMPMRLCVNVGTVAAPVWHPLFTGRIRDVASQQVAMPHGPPEYFTTVTVLDAVASHDEITRYGAMPPTGYESFTARIERLAQSAVEAVEPPIAAQFSAGLLGRTVFESSLSNHFTLAANSVGAWWYVDANNRTRFAPLRYDSTNPVWFSDRGTARFGVPLPPGTLHYLTETPDSGTSAQITAVVFRIKGATPNPDDPDAWIATETEDVRTPATDPLRWFGRRDVIVECVENSFGVLPAPAVSAYGYSWDNMLRSITWNAQEDLSALPRLDVGKSIYLTRTGLPYLATRSTQFNYLIIGVQHTITPTRWITTLDLMGV